MIQAHITLAAFGPKVNPEILTEENKSKDRKSLAALARHMMSRSSDEPSSWTQQQKSISMGASGKSLDLKYFPSQFFVDFLQLCDKNSFVEMEKVMKVSWLPYVNHWEHECLMIQNQFFRDASPRSLPRLVHNAERTVARVCFIMPS